MEELLKKEANLTDLPDINTAVDSNVNSVLAAYKSEGDPDLYEYSFLELRRFVDESLDIYKACISLWKITFDQLQSYFPDRVMLPDGILSAI